ncbi:conserved hypothetical protein [Uncinocarpus reesii 1704]|uniref:SET domain-containing protein n=1 Tax=Uncinocarpus reesii (strain UAMH 1704) TaxID=336963 RepID=C4JVZ2_UNCRE|nr:uncharacterized protein UREG_06734 [Uncinocarpus reesii 1704]EEP81869.1 conserved hypothetical protein [Uncinocarpus reesii 1704]
MAFENAGCNSELLLRRQEATSLLLNDTHNPLRHLQRGKIHFQLGFPDLAAADAYRALTLFEYVLDPESEYVAKRRIVGAAIADGPLELKGPRGDADGPDEGFGIEFEPLPWSDYQENIGAVYILLVDSLMRCGCMEDAYEFCVQGLKLAHGTERGARNETLRKLMRMIKESYADSQRQKNQGLQSGRGETFDPAGLQVQGCARRVVYPWNSHEPDRNSPQIVELLNERLKKVAPKCEVRAVELPLLHGLEAAARTGSDSERKEGISIQLGLFAKEDIAPGEVILHESSMLTATNRLHDDLCDACNSPLPQLDAAEPAVACENCDDIIFCSQQCYELASETYHGAICGEEGLESIGKDIPDPKDKADYLYLLLLARALAMAETQHIHPLDLPEVRYIWGDFHRMEDDPITPLVSISAQEPAALPALPPSATLPFSFQLNILQPMRILEEMGLNPFDAVERYDTWVLNTLYAKFRGTASGRLSTWDGGPEVCAVHPLWCLANHSCDPNVRWEWGGEITFVARDEGERVDWGSMGGKKQRARDRSGGVAIKKDEEILNHYCDLGLKVKERREWAMGALGGPCQCPRCVWEESLP